jgi:hypothetical protein
MPLFDPIKNFAKGSIVGTLASGVTTFTVSASFVSRFPNPSVDGEFNVVFWNATDYARPEDDPLVEILRITNISGTTFTCVRAQEGTSDADHVLSGKIYRIALVLTAKTITDIYDTISGAGVLSVNGFTGVVVLDTDDITEGTNKYYSSSLFNTDFSSKSTTNLSEGTNLYYTNARGIGSTLTGFTSGSGTVGATDTILQAIQKLDGNIALKANSASPTFTGTVTLDTLQASGSGGMTLKSNSGSAIALLGAGGGTNATFYGGVALGSASGSTGSLMFNGSTSGTVTLSVADVAGTWTMKLPDSAGTTGQVLTTDGTGVLSWATAGGGFSWGATASGTSGTGIGLTIGASASASTTMQSFTWDNTQVSATYGQQFNYGTSTTAKYGQYHNLTTQTGAIPVYIYYNNGTAFTSAGIFFQKAVGATIGGSVGALKFATLVEINSRIGTGIYFENLTGGTSSTSSTAYGIRFSNISNTATYAYAIKATYISNGGSGGRGYFFHADIISQASSSLGYVIAVDYGSNGSASTSYVIRVDQSGAGAPGSVFYGMSINSLSQANGATGFGMRITTITNVTGANGYGIQFDNVVGNGTTGIAIGIKMGLSIGSATAIGKFWELANTQIGASSNRTLAMATLSTIRSVNTAITVTDDFNVVEWTRSNGATNAGATYNSAGAIVKISNELYSTLTGTLNDTVIPLHILQHSNGTGAPIYVTQNRLTSTNFRQVFKESNTGVSIWISDGTDPNGALTGADGDICLKGPLGKTYYNSGGGTTWL